MAWQINGGSLAAGAAATWHFAWARWPGRQYIVARPIPTTSGGLTVWRPFAELEVSPPRIEIGRADVGSGQPGYTYFVTVRNVSSVGTTFQWEGGEV